MAYDRKIAGAAEACSQAGIALIPLAVGFLWRLASCGGGGGEEDGQGPCQACRHKGEEDEGKEERELFHLLGLLVQKGNAALFNNRVPDYGDIGHL